MSYIDIQHVSKIYRRNNHMTEALQDINLQIDQGTFVSLIGPSGCGKSTLLRIIGGLIEVDEGAVSIEQMSPAAAQKRKQFAFVPQSPALFPWRTIIQNMNLPFEVNQYAEGAVHLEKLDPISLLHSVGLGDYLHYYPGELSGGMQQRVGIARAFSSGSPILLMDEPFSALDEINREKLKYQLLDIWDKYNKTVIFVTHSIREAVLLSDKVVVMSSGPGKISEIININLPRPRHEGIEETEAFHRYVSQIRSILRTQW